MLILTQIIGFFGVLINLAIYQQKTGRRILIFKLLSDIVWAIHYFALSAYSGFLIACIGIVREIVFIRINKNSKKGIIWLILFCVLSLLTTVFTWKTKISFLPAVASICSVASFYFAIPHLSRCLAFPISLCMGIYSFCSASYAGVLNEVITIISSVIGIIRIDIKKGRIINE